MYKIPAENYPIIEEWVDKHSRVLDLGCGDGSLLDSLITRKEVDGFGVEISHDMILKCVQKGICVYQADIDRDLSEWTDGSFDYVILNATLQVITKPYRVIDEMLRVGRFAIISISNFGYLRNRVRVLSQGRVSSRIRLSESWHDTPVLRFVSLREFRSSLSEMGIEVMDARYFFPMNVVAKTLLPGYNLLAKEGIFKLRRAR
ncbi:MAG TPA: methionine biosynthesis protein MetW [Deltaproteobacteria bacterium]|nr:methionine biosynthesis protein MetW [Deltaproteobacteria bacterium]HOI06727.1 methionine biosynthesis protein MetW [Deltaproteobacteria bacterium]